MRANEFIKEEEKLDELLPLITGTAGLIGGAMKMAGGVASGVGAASRGIGKGVGAVAGAAGKKVAGMMGNDDEEQKRKDPKAYADIDRAKDTLLQPGKKLILPTQQGKAQPFKITKVAGDEVEIENPDAIKDPNQPEKITYKKQDIKKSISI
jgi:hypothetical protein